MAAAVLVSAGCHHFRGSCNKPGIYTQAQTLPPLKIPSGLQAPDTTQALKIPDLNEPAPPPRKRSDPCLDSPPPYAVPKPAPVPSA